MVSDSVDTTYQTTLEQGQSLLLADRGIDEPMPTQQVNNADTNVTNVSQRAQQLQEELSSQFPRLADQQGENAAEIYLRQQLFNALHTGIISNQDYQMLSDRFEVDTVSLHTIELETRLNSVVSDGFSASQIRQILFNERHYNHITPEEYNLLSSAFAVDMNGAVNEIMQGFNYAAAGNGSPTDINSDYDLNLHSVEDFTLLYDRLIDLGYTPEVYGRHGVIEIPPEGITPEIADQIIYMDADKHKRIDLVAWNPNSLELTGTNLLEIPLDEIDNQTVLHLPDNPEFTSLMRDPLASLAGHMTKLTLTLENLQENFERAYQLPLNEEQRLELMRTLSDEARTIAKSIKKTVDDAVAEFGPEFRETLFDAHPNLELIYQQSRLFHSNRADGYEQLGIWQDEQTLEEMIEGVEGETLGLQRFVNDMVLASKSFQETIVNEYAMQLEQEEILGGTPGRSINSFTNLLPESEAPSIIAQGLAADRLLQIQEAFRILGYPAPEYHPLAQSFLDQSSELVERQQSMLMLPDENLYPQRDTRIPESQHLVDSETKSDSSAIDSQATQDEVNAGIEQQEAQQLITGRQGISLQQVIPGTGMVVTPDDILNSGRNLDHPNSGIEPFPAPQPSLEDLQLPPNRPTDADRRLGDPNAINEPSGNVPSTPLLPVPLPDQQREDLTLRRTEFPAGQEETLVTPVQAIPTQTTQATIDIEQIVYDLNFYQNSGNVVITDAIQQLRDNHQLIEVISNSSLPTAEKERLLNIAENVMQGAPSIPELKENLDNAERLALEAQRELAQAQQAEQALRAQQQALAALQEQQRRLQQVQHDYNAEPSTPPAQMVTPLAQPSVTDIPSQSAVQINENFARIDLEEAQRLLQAATGAAKEQWQTIVNYVQENGTVLIDNTGRFYQEQVVPSAQGFYENVVVPVSDNVLIPLGVGALTLLQFIFGGGDMQRVDATPMLDERNSSLAAIDVSYIRQSLQLSGISGGNSVDNNQITALPVFSAQQPSSTLAI